ncbi:MAG: 2-dehydro-3-deoxyphosphooctonate aldolase [Flavobacterium sp.]|nr:2-dehydro-3-deoxyphosphooctonate aldolase [Flavobacterium sp.]
MKRFAMMFLMVFAIGCVSTKSTIKNIDDNAPIPKLNKNGSFVITEYSTDKKYGYDKDYPINVFYRNSMNESINQIRFLDALAGPNGEKIFYKKLESCCPFPTKKSEMGAGFLDVYEVSWVGQKKPVLLYMNIYEKGALMVPVGFSLKKIE